ncbi:hypothetical protein [Nocardioides mangrovi]|uniref:Integral membrane protein n=1 Tax=Nocardioides mangrovi TaxID=2874580 RepID=A0ABS7UA69_9ACTN|nr:hypothetical protein [Nocardioides mangrovi]MBZ5737767.1 hypothetical protein [Nocardioides mangrovi]
MTNRVDAAVLWLRAFVVGGLAFALGVIGHVMADGLLPGPVLLVALGAMSIALSAPMLSRPASTLRLVTMLVGGQTVIHLVLTVTAGHRGDATMPMTSHPGGLPVLPTVDGQRVGSLQDAYQGMSGQPSTLAPAVPIGHLLNDMSAHAPMMVVHLVAAALVGLWLGYGERCLWSVLALTGRRLLLAWTAAAGIVTPVPALRRVAYAAPAVWISLWQSQPRSRRGPPLLAA